MEVQQGGLGGGGAGTMEDHHRRCENWVWVRKRWWGVRRRIKMQIT